MIVVTGATGSIGAELTNLLSASGVSVRAISRRPHRQEHRPNVEWMAADLVQPDTLVRSFDGAERLFLVTGNMADMVPAQKNAIRAALNAGIRQVVKVSALGASDHSMSVIGMWHYVVEQVLKSSDLEWTILRPHVFMQNILDQKQAIIHDGKICSPSGDASIPMIDTRDIAAVAAATLTSDGHHEKRYTLSGPAPISWREIANVLSDVLGTPVAYVAETEDDAWHRLHGAGLPPWLIGAQLALAEYQRKGGGTGIVTDAVQDVTGQPPRNFRTFAEDYAAVLRSGR